MLLVFMLAPLGAHAMTGDKATFQKLADNVYAFVGKLNDANAMAIITTQGVVVVDTGNNPPETRILQKFIHSVTTQPVRYVVITQNYGDHTGGTPLFSPPATVIVQDRVAKDWAAMKGYQIRSWQKRGYVDAFDTAFGEGDISVEKVEMALATFERSIVSSEAPFDRWINGDDAAIDAAAKRGFALFNGKANCAACHSGWAFTDSSFHDIGTAHDDDMGRGRLFPISTALKFAFKTPTLRDVAHRAPYMHDGSVPTLEAVIDLYDRGGIERPSRDPEIRPLGLSAEEKADVIAFLRTLTGASQPVAIPTLPR